MSTPTPQGRLLPKPTPETQYFWDGCRRGELLLQSCMRCLAVNFPPRAFCPACGCRELGTVRASGKARLLSYVVSARPAPGIEAPYVLAIVRLEEGVQMMTNIVHCAGRERSLPIDMPLRVVFDKQNEDISLPMFEPEEVRA